MNPNSNNIGAQKTALNARVKAEMDIYLRSRTWEQKVESIERMNAASKIAREAMRAATRDSDESKREDDAI
jgi:hypothetical protein